MSNKVTYSKKMSNGLYVKLARFLRDIENTKDLFRN